MPDNKTLIIRETETSILIYIGNGPTPSSRTFNQIGWRCKTLSKEEFETIKERLGEIVSATQGLK